VKLLRLRVDEYKNLRNCKIEFTQPLLLNAVIGKNGSGKSNLIEALLHILIGFYFKKSPPFDFGFEFEAQERKVLLEGKDHRLCVRVGWAAGELQIPSTNPPRRSRSARQRHRLHSANVHQDPLPGIS
jgi:energy-coupling factor transporter ATP-binding protein EcfA2